MQWINAAEQCQVVLLWNLNKQIASCTVLECNKNIILCLCVQTDALRYQAKVLRTYVCVRTLVGSRTGEGDEFMAPFVNHKTAHWQKREKERRQFYSSNLWHHTVTLILHSTSESAFKKEKNTNTQSKISLFCLVFYASYRRNTKDKGSKAENVHVYYHQSTSKWFWQASLVQTHKQMQTDRHACVCTPTLTPTQKMSLRDLVCSPAVGFLQSVGLIASLSPTELGSYPYQKCHSAPT